MANCLYLNPHETTHENSSAKPGRLAAKPSNCWNLVEGPKKQRPFQAAKESLWSLIYRQCRPTWFPMFLIFTPIGEMIQFEEHVSIGLKPPIRGWLKSTSATRVSFEKRWWKPHELCRVLCFEDLFSEGIFEVVVVMFCHGIPHLFGEMV